MAEPVRMINTKAHALVDYLLGATLLLSPVLFDFPARGAVYVVPLVAGLLTMLLALVTRFEFSLFKLLPLRPHLYLDGLCGSFLAASPWLLGFCPVAYKPHLVFGLTLVVVALLTDRLLYDSVKGKREEKT